MANTQDINGLIKLAVDGHKGCVNRYSTENSQELIREALIEANHGKTSMPTIRDYRNGTCGEFFTLLETLLEATTVESLKEDDYFNALCETYNVSDGDSPVFEVQDSTLYTVAETAKGILTPRRQRINGVTKVQIPTSMKTVRVYENMGRVLSGKVDFNEVIDTVSKSFKQKLLNDIYAVWSKATASQLGGTTYFPAAGAYDEDTLLDVIAHVEAAADGKTATIIGTKKAIRNLKESIVSEVAKTELHTMGYYGSFYGSPVVVVPQRHQVGSTSFVFDDNVITIVAGDDKPIKVVNEGDPLIIMGDPTQKADYTQEYFYGMNYGVGLVLAGGNAGIGRYEISA